jgi:ornithine cyclodeaminase/alanine dehydrogenase-like protein (mu-crystallin family)
MALILSRTDIQRCLNMTEAIEAMRIAFGALSSGLAQVPQRMAVDLSEQGLALLMPSILQTSEQYAVALHIYTRARELGIGFEIDI